MEFLTVFLIEFWVVLTILLNIYSLSVALFSSSLIVWLISLFWISPISIFLFFIGDGDLSPWMHMNLVLRSLELRGLYFYLCALTTMIISTVRVLLTEYPPEVEVVSYVHVHGLFRCLDQFLWFPTGVCMCYFNFCKSWRNPSLVQVLFVLGESKSRLACSFRVDYLEYYISSAVENYSIITRVKRQNHGFVGP